MIKDLIRFCIFVFLKNKSRPFNSLINQYVQQYISFIQTKPFISYLQNAPIYLNKITIYLKSMLNTYNTYSQHIQSHQKVIAFGQKKITQCTRLQTLNGQVAFLIRRFPHYGSVCCGVESVGLLSYTHIAAHTTTQKGKIRAIRRWTL